MKEKQNFPGFFLKEKGAKALAFFNNLLPFL
jgi:hypothetical protein